MTSFEFPRHLAASVSGRAYSPRDPLQSQAFVAKQALGVVVGWYDATCQFTPPRRFLRRNI